MSYRKLFYAFNALMLAVFFWALAVDFFAEWRPYQAKYYKMAAESIENERNDLLGANIADNSAHGIISV